MFIAALFTIARTWKQTKCPLTDEWIKKMWYKLLISEVKDTYPMDIKRIMKDYFLKTLMS